MSPSKRRSERGYTLVELSAALFIVVIVAIAMLITVSLIMPRWRLRRAAVDVAAAIQAARAKAVINRTTVTMDMDTGRGIYVLHSEVSSGITVWTTDFSGSNQWFGKLPVTVRFARPDSGPAVTVSPPSAPGEDAARFNEMGLLQSSTRPGDIYLGVPSRGLYRRLRITLAGAVQHQRWVGTGWQ